MKHGILAFALVTLSLSALAAETEDGNVAVVVAAIDGHLLPDWSASDDVPESACAGWEVIDGTRSMALLVLPQVPFSAFHADPEQYLLRADARVIDRKIERPDDATFDLKVRYLSDEPRIRYFWARGGEDGHGGSFLLSANTSRIVPASLLESETEEIVDDQFVFLKRCDLFEAELTLAGTMRAFSDAVKRVRNCARAKPLEKAERLACVLALTTGAEEFGDELLGRASADHLLQRSTDRSQLVFEEFPGVCVDTVANRLQVDLENEGAKSVKSGRTELEFDGGIAREWSYEVEWVDQPRYSRIWLRGMEIEGGTSIVVAAVVNSEGEESGTEFSEKAVALRTGNEKLFETTRKLAQAFCKKRLENAKDDDEK